MRALILLCFLLSLTQAQAVAQTDDDRPTLKHQKVPSATDDEESPPSLPTFAVRKKAGVVVDGIQLPSNGHAWALDTVGMSQELAQLRFSATHVNNHRGGNVSKALVAPFVFRQKATVEIAGASAKVRLHSIVPVFYVRSLYSVDDTNTDDDQYAEPRLNLVKLRVDGDHRVANTINFGRVTLKAKRSEDVIETRIERMGSTGWFKITTEEPLTAGEYGLVPLPKTQNAFSTIILDFAVDPSAPENTDVVRMTP